MRRRRRQEISPVVALRCEPALRLAGERGEMLRGEVAAGLPLIADWAL